MNNPQRLIDRAAQLIKTGRNGAARPILAAVSAMGARDSRAAELGALLDMRDGHLSAARDALDRDLSMWPGHAGLRKLRAELRFNTEDLPGALEDAADCVIQDAHDPAAKALLGMLLLEAGHAQDAILCLAEAVRDAPFHPGYVQAFAQAQEAADDAHGAANTLRLGTANMPGDGSLRSAAVFLAVRQRDFRQAVVLAEAARAAGVADACTFGLLGHALSSLGEHSQIGRAHV